MFRMCNTKSLCVVVHQHVMEQRLGILRLEDMNLELNKEAEDDKAVYEELKCWCKTGKADKDLWAVFNMC